MFSIVIEGHKLFFKPFKLSLETLNLIYMVDLDVYTNNFWIFEIVLNSCYRAMNDVQLPVNYLSFHRGLGNDVL